MVVLSADVVQVTVPSIMARMDTGCAAEAAVASCGNINLWTRGSRMARQIMRKERESRRAPHKPGSGLVGLVCSRARSLRALELPPKKMRRIVAA